MDNYEHYYFKGKTRPGEETEDFPAETTTSSGGIDTSSYEDFEQEADETPEEITETPEEKETITIADQMLNTKRPSSSGISIYDKFNKKELRKALASGDISNEVLTKYLIQIPGVSIENDVVKGLENARGTDFNSAMALLQEKENINLGY